MAEIELLEALGQAWDDGNATGLDGYIGPNRGAGEVDPEAEVARERILVKLTSVPLPPAQVPVDREALERAAAEAMARHFPRRGMVVASGVTCDCDYWTGNEPQALLGAGMGGRDQLNRHRAQVAVTAVLALLSPEVPCNCGFGGFHDDANARCERTRAALSPEETK